jgi:hypothetical protein
VLTDWASGCSVAMLPEKGIYHTTTIRKRVEVAIVEIIERVIAQVEKEARKNGQRLMSQEIYDAGLERVYEILDDVTVINGKPTKYHEARLAKNPAKAVEKAKALRVAETFAEAKAAEVKTTKPRKVKGK